MRKLFKNFVEVLKESNLDNYKLCYIDEIPKTVTDYTEASKKYMSSPEYDPKKSKELYGYYDPNIEMQEFSNPEYIPGESTHYAYFTTSSLSEQWGDDWNDAPYEHNAGEPYDTKETTVIVVPFGIPESNRVIDTRFPCDYGINSPWSVEEINLGAIPWIFIRLEQKESITINAGISPDMFYYLLDKAK